METSSKTWGLEVRKGVLPGEMNLAEYLLARKGNSTTPCFVGPGICISSGEFELAVRRTAARICAEGVRPGERIVIGLDDSVELAALFFAGIAMGAVPLLVNPNLDANTVEYILNDCTPRYIFCKADNYEKMCQVIGHLSKKPSVAIGCPDFPLAPVGDAHATAGELEWDDFHRQDPNGLSLIQYSSGTTGKPKGIMHSAASVLASCEHFAESGLGLTGEAVVYSVSKTFFGYGMGNSLFFPLYLGGTALLDPRWPTPSMVMDNIRTFAPTVFFAVPTMFRKLLDENPGPLDLPVRTFFSAGAPLSSQLREAWRERTGLALHDGIGATELCHVFATSYPDAVRQDSVGRMLPKYQYAIVDEAGLVVEPGELGVLLVKAPCSSIGYWNNPAETGAKWNAGWYRTGDLFSEDRDGFLYFHGREDDRFKVFGRWVVPLEIESLAKRAVPELDDAFIVPGRDAFGENRVVLFLYAPKKDAEVIGTRCLTAISENLESYKRPVACLPLVEVPCTPNGKANRRELIARASAALTDMMADRVAAEVLSC